MKKITSKFKLIIAIILINSIAGIVLDSIFRSSILGQSKVSLAIIVILLGSGAMLFFVNKQLNIERSNIKTEFSEDLREEMKNIAESVKQLLSSPAKYTQSNTSNGILLEQRCKYLEEYRESFPLSLSELFTIYAISRKSTSVFSHSNWLISGEYQGKLFACNIARRDAQTYKEMFELVSEATCPDDLFRYNIILEPYHD